MDFSLYNTDLANEGVELVIQHPVTREDTDAVLKVLGADSRVYRKHYGKIFKSFTAKSAALGQVGDDEFFDANLDLLSRLVVAWTNVEYRGEPLECTPENVRMVLEEVPTIKAQVEQFVVDRRNFTKASSET